MKFWTRYGKTLSARLCLLVGLSLMTRGAFGVSQVELSATVSTHSIPLNQNFTLTVELAWSGAAADYNFEAPALSLGDQAAIVSSSASTSDWEAEDGLHSKQVYRYVLQPLRQGRIGIPSISVAYKAKAELEQQSIAAPVFEIEVTAPVVAREFPVPIWVVVAVSAGAIAAAMMGIYLRSHRRKKREAARINPTPADDLRARLVEARKHREMSESREFTLLLDKIIQDTLMLVKNQSGTEDPKANPNHPYPSACPHELVIDLKSGQEIIDRVKYAGHRPGSSELDRLNDAALAFISYLAGLKGV